MSVNPNIAAIITATGLALSAAQAQAATTVVDISAAGNAGTVVALSAGSYTVSFIDSSAGGLYDGYSPWSSNSGCDGAGMNCSTGFVANLAIDFGFGADNFNRQDGFQHGMLPVTGDNRIYATGAQALAAIQSGPIVRATLPNANNINAYTPTNNPISFTLAGAQSVNFFVIDNPYGDNRGGISIRLDDGRNAGAVPEPGAWALMILGFGAAGSMIRRRRAIVA